MDGHAYPIEHHVAARVATEHALPLRLCTDLLVGLLTVALVGAFVVLAQVYGPTQPLLLLVMPIPLASALILLIVVHDRRVANR